MPIKQWLLKEPPTPSLLSDIREVQAQLERVEACFAMLSDADLIDACIYERQALHARYRYLLGQVRAQGLHAPRIYEEPVSSSAMCPLPVREVRA